MPTIQVFNGTDASMDIKGNQMRLYEDKAQRVGANYWTFHETVLETMGDAKITVFIEFFSGNVVKICNLSKQQVLEILRETKNTFA